MAILTVKGTKASAASNSVSFSVSATAGNALIVGMGSFSGTGQTVTRTGDTYTTDTTGANGSNRVGIASAPNVAGGAVSMTVASTSAGAVAAFALEVSGLPTSAIRDATSPATLSGSASTGTTNTLTNATADAIYAAAVAQDSGANPATVTPGGSWTSVVGATTLTELNGSSIEASGLEWQIVASSASRTGSWTFDGSRTYCGAIAVYKMAAGVATKAPPPRSRPLRVWPRKVA